MSFRFSPKIVTDGLIFYLDAANKKSYPGSGTYVNSLMGGVTGSVENGVGFSSNNKGYFEFDGTNDYINLGHGDIFSFGDGSSDSPFSMSAWVVIDQADSFTIANKFDYPNYKAGEWQFYCATDSKLYLVLYDESVGSYGAYNYIYTGTLTSLEGQWLNIVGTYDGRGGALAYNGLKIYINGVVQSITTAAYATYVAMHNTAWDTYINKIGSYYSPGNVATFQVYNKELSTSEILQNYNALKYRFGL
jgi:hypothetical protein